MAISAVVSDEFFNSEEIEGLEDINEQFVQQAAVVFLLNRPELEYTVENLEEDFWARY